MGIRTVAECTVRAQQHQVSGLLSTKRLMSPMRCLQWVWQPTSQSPPSGQVGVTSCFGFLHTLQAWSAPLQSVLLSMATFVGGALSLGVAAGCALLFLLYRSQRRLLFMPAPQARGGLGYVGGVRLDQPLVPGVALADCFAGRSYAWARFSPTSPTGERCSY